MGISIRPSGVDNLSNKAKIMRESLHKSQLITDNMVDILGSFDHRLSALESAMRPTQVSFFFFYKVLNFIKYPFRNLFEL